MIDKKFPYKLRVVLCLGAIASGSFFVGQVTAQQSRLQNALSDLQQARAELVAANNNKGGYRIKAIRSVDQAISDVRAGIRYAGNR